MADYRQAMNYGKIIIKNNDEATAHQRFIPCWYPIVGERGRDRNAENLHRTHQITSSLQEMAVGLSQIISATGGFTRRAAT
ncbi:hypothetical protein OHD50_21435 [Escherichia coli]|nr:hypothetical protein [Escherichia coli]